MSSLCARCTAYATYELSGGTRVCGVHSRGRNVAAYRRPLPRRERDQQRGAAQAAAHAATLDAERYTDGRRGRVTIGRLFGFRTPTTERGYQNVLLVATTSTLTAERLGPVMHGMAWFPPATSLLNYITFAWHWREEMHPSFGAPNEDAVERRITAYADPRPLRAKFPARTDRPQCGVFYTMGAEHVRAYCYNELEMRYAFAHHYERLVVTRAEYRALHDRLAAGYHLRVLGPRAPPSLPSGADALWTAYQDTTRPFDAEMVLFTMLTVPARADWPWRRYRRAHPRIYVDVFPSDN